MTIPARSLTMASREKVPPMRNFRFGLAAMAALAAPALPSQTLPPQPVSIQVRLDQPLAPVKPIYSWFGYDEANYTSAPHGRQLLTELHDLAPVPVYIRAHHLLTSGDGVPELKWSSTNVYREDPAGNPVYDFTLLDGIFDAYKAAGVRPMVELGFMPKDLAASLPSRPEPYQVHYPQSTVSGASNNPPKDYARWGELIRTVTAHLAARYGRETVLTWYFEVWNEPNIDYWHGSPEDYWKLYDYAVAGVRAALPGAIVGGPASTGPGNQKAYEFLDNFLAHVDKGVSAADGQPVPLDFISFHAKGQPTIANGQVTMGLRNELIDVDRGFELVASYPRFRNLPMILSEADPEGCAACSSKVNPANNYRNGTLYPTYTAAAYKALFDLEARRGVNLLAMLSWSFEFEDKDYFEGFRSLATNGIDKPILNFFRMAAQMAGNRVATASTGAVPLDSILASGVRSTPDVDAMATAADHEAAVLLWNYSDAAQPENAGKLTPVAVALSGIPVGVNRVQVREFRIDDTHSNAYTVWQAMGSPQHPTAQQYADLKKRDGLEALDDGKWLQVANRQVTIQTLLPRQSVSLLQVRYDN